LSMSTRMNATLEGRAVGILVDDGSDDNVVTRMRMALVAAGATVKIIAPKINVAGKAGPIAADGQLAGTPSVLVDAIALVLTPEAATKLCADSAAVQFVADAFAHLKAIGHDGASMALLDRAGVIADEGVTDLGEAFLDAAAQRFWDREPVVRPVP
jgi:catalase